MKHCASCAKDEPNDYQFCTECGLPLAGFDTEAETLKSYQAEPLHGFPDLEVTLQPQGGQIKTVKAGEWVGTKGQRRGVEGFSVRFNPPRDDLSLRYMGHYQVSGDTDWVTEGTFLVALPSPDANDDPRLLEGFAIELIDEKAADFSIRYSAHIQAWDDTREHRDGEFCGSRGLGLRVEAVKIQIFQTLTVTIAG